MPALAVFISNLGRISKTLRRTFMGRVRRLDFLGKVRVLVSSESSFAVQCGLPSFRGTILYRLDRGGVGNFFSSSR